MLSFEDVWWSGEEGSGLRGVSFRIAAGECAALADGDARAREGVVSLCLGEVRPPSGRVCMAGRDTSALGRTGRKALYANSVCV